MHPGKERDSTPSQGIYHLVIRPGLHHHTPIWGLSKEILSRQLRLTSKLRRCLHKLEIIAGEIWTLILVFTQNVVPMAIAEAGP